MQAVSFRLLPENDLRQSLLDYCKAHAIDAACIISCVGSLRRAVIRLAGSPGGTHFEKKMEILTLSGTLSHHGCHLHIAVADEQGVVVGGHLMDGSAVYTTAEIVLGIVPDMTFNRKYDAATGYRELDVRNKQ